MIKIFFRKKLYEIKKEKIIFILDKLGCENIKNSNIKSKMKKMKLYDEMFLENICEKTSQQ